MKKKASENSLIILVERYDWNVDLNMGYNHSFIEGYGLNENGAIIHIDLKKQMDDNEDINSLVKKIKTLQKKYISLPPRPRYGHTS